MMCVSSCAPGSYWDTATNACMSSCTGGQYYDTAAGMCVCSAGSVWNGTTCAVARTSRLGTPGKAQPPAPGMMYDAFGVQVPIPTNGYRNIGFIHSVNGTPAGEITLNETTVISSSANGAITSFDSPSVSGGAVDSTNRFNVGMGSSVQMDFGTDPVSGMSWGRWQGGAAVLTDLATGQAAQASLGGGSVHWFATPNQTQSVNLPLTGVVPYTLIGHTTPTDAVGNLGVLNSANLTANFTNQTVDMGVNVTMPTPAAPPVTIDARALGVPILPGGNFATNNPSITCTSCAGPTAGAMAGQFTNGGAGVGVGYGLQNGSQSISGAVIFRK